MDCVKNIKHLAQEVPPQFISAGIRVLVMQHKKLQALNGMFYITESSENVAQVLGMVGMAKMFSVPEHKSAPGAEVKEKEFVSKAHGYSFRMQMLNDKASTTVKCPGSPQKIITPGYNESDTRIVVARQGAYALGLGALGDSFQACSERFGEYVLLNGTAAYLPSDGSKKPDYMISRGQLTARLAEVYGLHFSAPFSHRILFEPTVVEAAMDQMINAAAKAQIPLFINNTNSVYGNTLFGLGAKYTEVGYLAGQMAADVLEGKPTTEIGVRNMVPLNLLLNEKALSNMRDANRWNLTSLQTTFPTGLP